MDSSKDIHGKIKHLSHWQAVYKRRRRKLQHTERDLLLGQILSLFGALVSGLLLETGKETLAMVTGAFLLLPGILDLGGSIGGALSAKLAHALEQGGAKVIRTATKLTLASIGITLLSSVVLGLVGAVLATVFFKASFGVVLSLGIASSVAVGLLGMPLVTAFTLIVRKAGLNPDNIIGPVETSIFDSLTVITMTLIIGWYLL